jgi:hypothetical protein
VKRERKLIAEKGHSFSGYAGTVTRAVKPVPMILGNMRANGVRTSHVAEGHGLHRRGLHVGHYLTDPYRGGPLALVDCLGCKVDKGRRSIGALLVRLKRAGDPRVSILAAFKARRKIKCRLCG